MYVTSIILVEYNIVFKNIKNTMYLAVQICYTYNNNNIENLLIGSLPLLTTVEKIKN